MYGENGSGKSSLFWGIYTLLEASFKQPIETDKYFQAFGTNDESLVNVYAVKKICPITNKEHCDSYIKIKSDNNTEYVLSLLDSTICGNTNAQESRKATDFINYQSIFKFQDFKNSETPDLYEVFNYSVLPYVTFPSFPLKGKILTNAGLMWEEYKNGPGKTINYKGDTILVYKHSPEYKNFLAFEKHFNENFTKLVDFINAHGADFVKKLGYNIKFELKYTPPAHIKKDKNYEWTAFRIDLIITSYNGQMVQIKKPQSFLNEAKMSAVAVAIRLAIIDYRINTAVPDALKVLVLDDLMISLDMGNRDKLMDLLLDDFANRYQILFFTHDRMLFDFVNYKIKQHKQNTEWLRKEMYVGEDDITKREYPVLLDSETDISRAMKHYKNFDFPASANYLRKAVEALVKDTFPPKFLLQDSGLPHDKLRSILDFSVKFFRKIPKFDISKLLLLIRNLDILLNPLSHKISETTVYKTELKEVFVIINSLKTQIGAMCIKEILPRKSKVYLYFKENAQTTQKYEIELQEEMYTYEMNANKNIYQPNARSLRSCTITNGIEGEFNKNERYKGTLEDICKKVHSFKRQMYNNNYLELYKNSQDTKLINIL